MNKYEKFQQEFESSGLNQKEYAASIGKSAGSVHYMLKKASSTKTLPVSEFVPIKVVRSSSAVIKITTSSGTSIEIPL